MASGWWLLGYQLTTQALTPLIFTIATGTAVACQKTCYRNNIINDASYVLSITLARELLRQFCKTVAQFCGLFSS